MIKAGSRINSTENMRPKEPIHGGFYIFQTVARLVEILQWLTANLDQVFLYQPSIHYESVI